MAALVAAGTVVEQMGEKTPKASSHPASLFLKNLMPALWSAAREGVIL